jgi:hypothetical protein
MRALILALALLASAPGLVLAQDRGDRGGEHHDQGGQDWRGQWRGGDHRGGRDWRGDRSWWGDRGWWTQNDWWVNCRDQWGRWRWDDWRCRRYWQGRGYGW